MERYVDGFVIPVPRDNIEAYREVAEKAAQVWKDHGAIEYWECVGDDLAAAHVDGPISFCQLAGASDDETVVFAWVVFESREQRDQANEKIMADPRLKEMMDPEQQIFDCKRMAYGGFKQLVHA